jgi:hypothetical protein
LTSIEDVIRLLEAARDGGSTKAKSPSKKPKKAKRKPSAYAQRYGRAFKKLAPKYKTKAGKWKKDGFKRCQKAAHREAKR